MVLNDVAAFENSTSPSVHEREPRLRPGQDALGVEQEDLARFEGEGGLEAPEPATLPKERVTNESKNLRSRSP